VGGVTGQPATEQTGEHKTKPSQALAVPHAFARHRGGGGFSGRESAAHAEPQFEIPGHEIEVALTAHLAPEDKNGDQSNQKLRGICETKNGHV